MNRDQHQVQDVRVLASMIKDDGVQVIATPRMEIGVPNVLHVQVNEIFVKFTNSKLYISKKEYIFTSLSIFTFCSISI